MKVDNLTNILKQGSISIPFYLITNYQKLNITAEEFIILIYLINLKNNTLDYQKYANDLNMDKNKLLEIINHLNDKKILEIKVEKNNKGKFEEYISLDLFYEKISLLVVEKIVVKKEDTSLYETFESEFGRLLSPMEYQIIKAWIDDNFNEELIVEALREATYNGVSNLRYIDKILFEWRKKGIKSKIDIKKNYQKKENNKIEVFDYNWLEDKNE